MRNLFGELLPPEPRDIAITAEFAPSRRARLSLLYSWDDDLPAAAFLMNNPSVAQSSGPAGRHLFAWWHVDLKGSGDSRRCSVRR